MFFAAVMIIWASEPGLQPPEARLPVGAVARLGNAKFTRPYRSSDSCAFSRDGQYFIVYNSSSFTNFPLEYWDLKSLRRVSPPIRLLNDEQVLSITRAGITTSDREGYYLRDEKTGAIKFEIPLVDYDFQKFGYLRNLTFCDNGQIAFATSNQNEIICIRRLDDGSCIGTKLKDANNASMIAVAENGSAVAWVENQIEIKRCDITTGVITKLMTAEEPMPICSWLTISPNGSRVVAVFRDRNYDREPVAKMFTGTNPKAIELNMMTEQAIDMQTFERARFLDDNTTLVNNNGRQPTLWSTETGKTIWTKSMPEFNRSPIFSSDGKRYAAFSTSGQFQVFDTINGQTLVPTLERYRGFDTGRWVEHDTGREFIVSIRGMNDGKTGDRPGQLVRWKPESKDAVITTDLDLKESWSVESISDDAKLVGMVLTRNNTNTYRIRDLKSGRTLSEWDEPNDQQSSLGPFLPGGDKFITRRGNQTAVFTSENARPLVTLGKLKLSSREIELRNEGRFVITPDRRMLIVLMSDSTSIVGCELSTGEIRYERSIAFGEQRSYYSTSNSMAISGDGKSLFVSLNSSILKIDPMTGKILTIIESAFRGRRRSGSNSQMVASKNGRWLAFVLNSTNDIHIIDCESHLPKTVRVFRGATGSINNLHLTHDDQRLMSLSDDGTAIVWDTSRVLYNLQMATNTQEELWYDLGIDGETATRAMTKIIDSEANMFFASVLKRWQPIRTMDATELTNAIQKLDAADYDVRERSRNLLIEHVEQAKEQLITAARSAKSAEMRAQAKTILDDIEGADRDQNRLRWRRTIELAERIQTPDAMTLLKKIAAGPAFCRMTQEARSSLERIKFRAP